MKGSLLPEGAQQRASKALEAAVHKKRPPGAHRKKESYKKEHSTSS